MSEAQSEADWYRTEVKPAIMMLAEALLARKMSGAFTVEFDDPEKPGATTFGTTVISGEGSGWPVVAMKVLNEVKGDPDLFLIRMTALSKTHPDLQGSTLFALLRAALDELASEDDSDA